MRHVATILLSIGYWILALIVFVYVEAVFDSGGAGDGLGVTNGLVPLAWLLCAAGGFFILIMLRREARY